MARKCSAVQCNGSGSCSCSKGLQIVYESGLSDVTTATGVFGLGTMRADSVIKGLLRAMRARLPVRVFAGVERTTVVACTGALCAWRGRATVRDSRRRRDEEPAQVREKQTDKAEQSNAVQSWPVFGGGKGGIGLLDEVVCAGRRVVHARTHAQYSRAFL